MTKPERSAHEDGLDARSYLLHVLGWSLLLALALIAFSVVAVATVHYIEERDQTDLVLALGGVPIALIAAYALWRWMPDFTMGEPQTPRGRRIRWTLLASGIGGGLASLPLLDIENGGTLMFGNGPVPPASALIVAALWGLLLPVSMITFRRNADEVTRAANNFGFSVGFQAFAYAAPLWWIGWRGGFLPQPDVMILFIAALVTATIANLWKRFA